MTVHWQSTHGVGHIPLCGIFGVVFFFWVVFIFGFVFILGFAFVFKIIFISGVVFIFGLSSYLGSFPFGGFLNFWCCLYFLVCLNPIPYGLFNKPKVMGGAVIWLSEDIFNILFNRGLVLDLKGQNPKAQPSTLKIVALRIFEKSSILAKFLKCWKFAI